MNLPNKLTILRMLMIIPFVVFMLVPIGGAGKWIALALFVIASLTDLLDGKIARKYNLVTCLVKLKTCFKNRQNWEFLLWHNGICGISVAPG